MSLLTGSQLAKLTGTSRQNIYKLVRNGKLVKDSNNNYDTENPKNFNYIQLHEIKITDINKFSDNLSNRKQKKDIKLDNQSLPGPEIKPKKEKILKPVTKKTMKIENQEELNELDNDLMDEEIEYKKAFDITGLPRKLLNMNMKDLVLRHGNLKELDNLSKILPRLFMAQEKETKDQERKNQLVPKEWTESKLFLYLEILNCRLLDYPENIVDKIIAFTLSDKSTARLKSIELMRNDFEVFLTDTKNKIDDECAKLTEKYQSEFSND